MATKATSNEKIIAALLQHGTIKEAAEAIGITPRTIYDRMKSRDFMADYAAAKSDILRSAVVNVSGKLSQAFEEINGIMTDKGINPAIRLQAAQTIINSASKLTAQMRTADEDYNKNHVPLLW